MPYTLLVEEFHSDPKTVKAGLAGAGLYARALSYCGNYLTDGFVPKAWAGEIATAAVRKKVTAAGLWVEVSGGEHYEYVCDGDTYRVRIVEPGYFIPDYLAYNPTRASVMEKREELSQKRAEAGRKGAMKRWSRSPDTDGGAGGKGDGKPNGKAMAKRKQTDSPQALSPYPEELQDDLPGRQFVPESLPIENELLATRLMARIGDHADQGTATVVRRLAAKLPPASIAKVVESLEINHPRDRAAYAVSALRSETAERSST